MARTPHHLFDTAASPAAAKGVFTKIINNYRKVIDQREDLLAEALPVRDQLIQRRVDRGWQNLEQATRIIDEENARLMADLFYARKRIAEATTARAEIV